jgi:hypothetical protein
MTDDILDFDDSFILKKHKETLKEAIHLRITTNPDYEVYDNTMLEILCLDMYKKTINGINKEQYLREIEEEEEKKKNMFQFPETPHIKGIVVENKETDYYVKNESEEINSPTNNAETSN